MKSLPSKIIDFLEQHTLAVIATIPEGGAEKKPVLKSLISSVVPSSKEVYPHVTCVFYVHDEVGNLFFASHLDSNRLKHIKDNPNVGIAITDEEKLLTLRLEGTASFMTMDESVKEIGKKIAEIANSKSYPSLPPFMKIEGQPIQITKITIKHYYFSQFSNDKAVIAQGTIS